MIYFKFSAIEEGSPKCIVQVPDGDREMISSQSGGVRVSQLLFCQDIVGQSQLIFEQEINYASISSLLSAYWIYLPVHGRVSLELAIAN